MQDKNPSVSLLDQQREIQNRCYHPLGGFEPFERNDLEQSISARFEKQVQKYPDRLAVKVDDQEITYSQLNYAANRIARVVHDGYGGNDSPIVLLLEHGIPMISGILGVLKAGGIYVPLDPLFPHARNTHIMSDSQAGLIVTNTRNLEYAKELNQNQLPLINIDEIKGNAQADNLDISFSPEQTAYILYTSGSTGLPKGVYQCHRNLLHDIMQYTNTLHICHNDRMTLLYSFNVNGHLRGVFGAILNGAALFPYDVKAKGLADVAAWLNKEEITFFHSVPTVFRHFIDTLHGDEKFPHVRLIRFGGERVPVDNVDFYKQHFPDHCILYTGMGSTEAGTVRQYFTDKNTVLTESVVPTGFAVDEREVILLDEQGREVGFNEVGQIAIKSRYLALGYWGKPEETSKKFITSSEDNSRLYLTGDLGRILPDGRLIHMGRSDSQVKVRGHRVETAEIEAILLKHPGVKEAAVVAWPDGHGDNYLAAYTVFQLDNSPKTGELYRHLRESLPDYMIPAAFVVLEAMPLTPNSKINKLALPRPEKVRPELETEFVAPETPVEKTLVDICAGILGINEIGIHDNFFELGGHSLAATRVVSRIRDSFEIELPLRAIFETPTIAHIAELVTQYQNNDLKITPIGRTSREKNKLPLSFAQQRLWFLDKLEPDSSAYHIITAHRLVGHLNLTALEESFKEITRRHEILRTIITTDGDQPLQTVLPELDIPLNLLDIGHLAASEQEAKVQELIKQAQLKPFNLAVGPLIRITLIKLNSTGHIIVVVMHHIISDAWSMNVLFKELSKCYEAFCEGRLPSLAELPIQYGDFVDWQRNRLQGEVLTEQIAYWKQQLKNSPSVLTLPEDFPRPSVQTFRGGQHSLILPFETSKALQDLSKRENVTLFAVLLTAFKLLLYRHTKQDGVVLGIPIASRNRKEVEELIGFFISTLVLYTPISPEATFKELLSQEREILLGAYEHQDIPFEKLVEELRPERDLSHTPLFQIFFNMTTEELHKLTLKDLQVELTMPAERESKFDMTLYVNETNGDIRLKLVYNADLFLKERMVELLEQFRALLLQIIDSSDKPILTYSLITPISKPILPDPTIELDIPRQPFVMDMFDYWAKQNPVDTAIRHGKLAMSYSELSEASQSIAHALRATGLGRGQVAAVYGRRSIGLIAGMLGVLMSGSVLLSIDPNLPDKRKQVMYRESGARALIYIDEKHGEIAWLDTNTPSNLILVKADSGKLLNGKSNSKPSLISWADCDGDDPAYIFFTSGTTGVPKGVLGRHKGLSHFLDWQYKVFSVGPGDRSAQLTGLSFDVVMRDVFLPLTSGATLCLPENVDDFSVDQIIPWFKQEKISVLHTVPTLAQTWLSVMASNVSLPELRLTFFAGEPLTDSLVKNWRSHFPNARVINLYGPTETTLAKCYYEVPDEPRTGIQPVGRSLPQTQVLVLSPTGEQCGIGEMGEIVIRTPFRSLGYINAPDEKQKKFIPSPFRNDASDILYVTGDRGRYRLDGLIEILGRVDDQVKIRGVRIEPGEINAVLARYPGVNACVVIARRDDGSDLYLAAYIVSDNKDKLIVSDLREYLEQRLVAAMIPRAFIFMDELPRTPNGKIDRRALPAPQLSDLATGNFIAPRDELELKLVKIWERLLNTSPIGVQDNFFDVGGHSLLAVRLFAQIKKVVGIDLPLATLFHAPTIEKLAELLRDDGWRPAWSSLVPMQPEGTNPPLFCVHAVGGNVLSLRDLARHLGKDQPFYALQSKGLDGMQTPPSKVEDMARYYIEEIQTVQPSGPYYLVGQSSGGIVAFEMAHQLLDQGHEVAFLALIDTYEPRRQESLTISRADRYNYHIKNIKKSGLLYLVERVQDRLRGNWRNLQRKMSKRISVIYQRMGRPIPYSFRHSYVSRAIQLATRNYTPRVYPGQIILFRAKNTIRAYVEEQYGVQRGWRDYATGGFEMYDIEGAHNLEQEPFVEVLADLLKKELIAAQNPLK